MTFAPNRPSLVTHPWFRHINFSPWPCRGRRGLHYPFKQMASSRSMQHGATNACYCLPFHGPHFYEGNTTFCTSDTNRSVFLFFLNDPLLLDSAVNDTIGTSRRGVCMLSNDLSGSVFEFLLSLCQLVNSWLPPKYSNNARSVWC